MKKLFIILLAVVLASGLVLSGCAEEAPAPTPTPTPTPAPTPTPTPAPKEIILDYETFLPSVAPDIPVDEAFFKGLEEATGGQVKTEFHLGAVMGSPVETYDRIMSGVSDVGQILPGYTPGVFSVTELFLYPIYCDKHETVVKAMLTMYDKGYLENDFATVVPMALSGASVYVLYSNEKITRVDQLKGKKLRAAGEVWAKASECVDAVGVTTSTGEVYGAFQTGILDGAWWVWPGVIDYSVQEVANYALPVNMTCFVHVRGMNREVFESLPDPGKKYITDNWTSYSMDLARAYDDLVPVAQAKFLAESPDHELTAWEPGELEKLGAALGPVWDVWVDRVEGKGISSKEVATEAWNILKDLGVETPFIGYTP